MKPDFSNSAAAFRTQGCSMVEIIISLRPRFSPSLRIAWKTILLDSEPPEVNKISSLWAAMRSATCERACSKSLAAWRPSSCILEALANISSRSMSSCFTSLRRAVVALLSM